MSFRNLTQVQAAQVMEMYVVLTGIVLFTPLFLPEQDREIWRLEQSKEWPMWRLYLLRIITAVASQAMVITAFVGILVWENTGLEGSTLWWGSFCEVMFLGSLGYFVSALTNQAVLGYMISILFYAANIGISQKLGALGLFQMMRGGDGFQLPMLAVSMLILAAGILLRETLSRGKAAVPFLTR